MHYRWTIKELETWNDEAILLRLCYERRAGLNPYAPLAKRLKAIEERLERKSKAGKD